MTRAQTRPAQPGPRPSAGSRLAAAASRFIVLLPALVLAFACLRAAEFGAAWPAGLDAAAAAWCIARAIADDALTLLRYLPLLFLGSLPLLLSTSRRRRLWGVGLAWSVLVLAQAGLLEYFVTARVPLGADLNAYSTAEIHGAVSSTIGINPWIGTGTLVALACLWAALVRRTRDTGWQPAPHVTAILCALGLAALCFGPAELPPAHGETEYARSLRLSKAACFLDGNIGYARRALVGWLAQIMAPAESRYPFLHAERTPDVLGPAFEIDPGSRPNFVFVIVEGLGRSFSGPEAPLGSFTPFLDELAERSLYWDNFLANQGRTFAMLPSLFGSLPFAEQGFSALGERMPQHTTLLSVLTSAGYRLRFFSGFDAAYDDERAFLERQGVDTLLDRTSFGPGYPRTEQWRYDDAELVSLALSAEARDDREPFVDIIQTITMHDPYRFSGEDRYRAEVETRLDRIGIADAQRAPYRAYRDIYASILYADDALRHYFDEASKRRSYHNTIFIVTGDHRLP
ncbi:MAG: LTA synthase family protein, partial [Deltaproteobacteria bacterium]